MNSDLEKYIDFLFSFDNPVFYSVFLMSTIVFIIIIFVKYIIIPLQQKHLYEKKELELKNVRLMALFSELDPDPVFRINTKGLIIFSNDAAKNLSESVEGKHINDLLPLIDINIEESIKNSNSYSFYYTINNKYFSVLYRGIAFLEIAQIYLNDITERKEYEDKLRELSNHLQIKIEEERQRISRELHDGIGQRMSSIRMMMQRNAHHFSNGSSDEYQNTISLLDTTVEELREISNQLKPKLLVEMGLAPALTALCNTISRESGIQGSIDIKDPNRRLENTLETTLYRITQEILNNMIKHSKAKMFDIQFFNSKPNSVKLMISDDGIGFDVEEKKKSSGMGLLNIRERVDSFKGKLEIESQPGTGTLFVIEIPTEGR